MKTTISNNVDSMANTAKKIGCKTTDLIFVSDRGAFYHSGLLEFSFKTVKNEINKFNSGDLLKLLTDSDISNLPPNELIHIQTGILLNLVYDMHKIENSKKN